MKNLIMIFAIIMFCISAHSQTTQSDTIWVKEIGNEVHTVKFSPDGKYIYAVAIGRKPMKLNAETGEILMEYDFMITSSSMDITNDGTEMVVGGGERQIRRYNLENGKLLMEYKIPDSLNTNQYFYMLSIGSLSISNDKRYLVAALFGINSIFENVRRVMIWDYQNGQSIKILHYNWCENVLFSPTQSLLAISHSKSENNNIILMANGTWETTATLCCHSSLIKDIAFSPDGSMLASCGWGGEIKVWDIEKKQIKTELKSDNYYSTSIICVDELNIIAGGYAFTTGGVELWKSNQTTPYKKYRIGLYDLDYLQSKKLLSVASGTSITLIDLSLVLNVVQNSINEFSISPNPSNSLFNINFSLQQSGIANVEIIDINSNQISLLFKGFLEEGNHNFQWQTHSIPSGTYFCRISTQTYTKTFKILKQE